MSATDNHTPSLTQDSTRATPQFHPLAEMFPLMEGAELKALAADIGAHGLVEPIILYEDKILDGRNRYLACREAGVEPTYRPLLSCDDPLAFVVSANLHRRHLTSEQKRALIDKLLKADPTKSDRQIANTVKADNKTVATRRELAEAREEIPHVEKRKDSRGRQQPRRKATAPATPSVPQSALDKIVNSAEASAAARRAAYAAEERQVDTVLRNADFSTPDEAEAAAAGISAGDQDGRWQATPCPPTGDQDHAKGSSEARAGRRRRTGPAGLRRCAASRANEVFGCGRRQSPPRRTAAQLARCCAGVAGDPRCAPGPGCACIEFRRIGDFALPAP